jgi:predicted ATPase/class 3 adenylate cyclase
MKTTQVDERLPEGTVTFLFTDIEGSTTLLKQLSDKYANLLSEQREILRETFALWKGQEVDTQGDSFFVSFPRATNAVSAAVEIQRTLHEHKWPEGAEVRLRMGLHTGEPLTWAEGYVGMDVHRAARIAHVGHGGQVLLSETTTSLVRDGLPEKVCMQDLGLHLLKDMKRPERIHQLVIKGLPSLFPALKSQGIGFTPTTHHNLPATISSFVGRLAILERITECLEDSKTHLVTLTGPPGVGKTRLALEAAWRQLEQFESGVIWVDLATVESERDTDLVLATTIGVEIIPANIGDLESAIVSSLSRGPILLVLDNCEHILESITRLTGLLERRCPQLKILATSRERLRVTAEIVIPIAPLELPTDGVQDIARMSQSEAIQLLIDRALSVDPTFSLTEKNAPLIHRLCRELDGIPLAIELAAARLHSMSIEEIAGRLGEKLQLLTAGSRDVAPRLQTLLASLQWSYDLLEPLERVVLDRLSVFRGGCELSELGLVCSEVGAETSELQEILISLIEKSLILRSESLEGKTRYSLLESMAELGRENLQDRGEWNDMRRLHAEAYYHLVAEAGEHISIQDDAVWVNRVFEDEANIRVALQTLLDIKEAQKVIYMIWSLRFYIMHRTLMVDMKEILLRAMSQDANISPDISILGLAVRGMLAWWEQDEEIWRTYAAKLQSLGREQKNANAQIIGMILECEHKNWAYTTEEGNQILKKVGRLSKTLQKSEGEAYEYEDVFELFLIDIKPPELQPSIIQNLIERAEIRANTNHLALCHQKLGEIYEARGALKAAEEHYWSSHKSWKNIRNRGMASRKLWGISFLYQCQGEYSVAYDLLRKATEIARSIGHERGRGIFLYLGFADLFFHQGELGKAKDALRESEELCRRNVDFWAGHLLLLARITHCEGELEKAEDFLHEALETVRWPSFT